MKHGLARRTRLSSFAQLVALAALGNGLGCSALSEQPRCHTDENCLVDQVCDQVTSTCVAPGAADAGTLDRRIADAAQLDHADAASAEHFLADSATPDSETADGATADGAAPDSATADSATADGATADGAAPDSATADSAAPDSATADSAAPDSAMPDTATPDTAATDLGACQPPGDWWDTSFPFRQRLTFDNSGQGEALVEFPVLVVLSATSFNYAQARADGADLRFVDEDGIALLSHQIESWDAAGDSYIWVEVPNIDASSSSDFIWLYYGDSAAADVQDPGATFSNGYLAVWHLDETTSPVASSAAPSFTCTLKGGGGGDPDAEGQINGANRLDGVDDHIDCGSDRFTGITHHTISAWVNLDLSGAADHYEVLANERISRNPYPGISLYVQSSDGAVGRWIGSDYEYTALQVTEGAWSFIAIRGFKSASVGYVEVSVNGSAWELLDSGNTNYLEVNSDAPLVIGTWPGGGADCYTKGVLDEIRISSVVRSEAWMRAQYLSTSNAFVSVSAEEPRCP